MAETLLEIGRWYVVAGGLVAAAFLTVGVGRVDDAAGGAFAFRPLLVPAILLLWPIVLIRWRALANVGSTDAPAGDVAGGAAHRPPRRLQNGAALSLAVAIPLLLTAALLVRQDGPLERPAVPLTADAAAGETAQ